METNSSPEPASMFVAYETPDLNAEGPIVNARRKRRHHKSRFGCTACKHRRVKCDESSPCSNCVRRKEKCVLPNTDRAGTTCSVTRPGPSYPNFDSGPTQDVQINLLHMELFHHFGTELKDTLSFRQLWPLLLRQSFHEPYLMCTILCLSATHLSLLRPESPRYSHAALQLLVKSAQLFRQNLSQPITPDNSDALMGTSIMMQYLLWCNLGFLKQKEQDSNLRHHPGLDFSNDQLFLLGLGVQRIFFKALPLFLSTSSIFLSIAVYRPRVRIEEVVRRGGADPERLVDLFMRMWDDPRYRIRGRGETLDGDEEEEGDDDEEEAEMRRLAEKGSCCEDMVAMYGAQPEIAHLLRMKGAVKDTTPSPPFKSGPQEFASSTLTPASAVTRSWMQRPRTARELFERVVRSLAIILCHSSPQLQQPSLTTPRRSSGDGKDVSSFAPPQEHDLERYLFSFPILAGGSFFGLARAGDTRALIVLFHFYRATRLILTGRRSSWWAEERSRVLEGLILRELRGRGVAVCLRG